MKFRQATKMNAIDEILVFLLHKGALKASISLTTIELGRGLGMSQQNASRRLTELEDEGYIERDRNGMKIKLTQKARAELSSLYATLKNAFEHGALEFKGTIVSGMGEGKYYLSLEGYRRQIREKLGFDPFPGTLNLRLDKSELWKRQQLMETDAIVVSGFRDKERTYGDLFTYKCKIKTGNQMHNAGGRMQNAGNRVLDADCAVVVPLRTHHGSDIIEVICASEIKKKLGKKDGDVVTVVLL